MGTQTTVSNAHTKLVNYDEIPFCIQFGEENEVPHISSNYCGVVYDDKLSLQMVPLIWESTHMYSVVSDEEIQKVMNLLSAAGKGISFLLSSLLSESKSRKIFIRSVPSTFYKPKRFFAQEITGLCLFKRNEIMDKNRNHIPGVYFEKWASEPHGFYMLDLDELNTVLGELDLDKSQCTIVTDFVYWRNLELHQRGVIPLTTFTPTGVEVVDPQQAAFYLFRSFVCHLKYHKNHCENNLGCMETFRKCFVRTLENYSKANQYLISMQMVSHQMNILKNLACKLEHPELPSPDSQLLKFKDDDLISFEQYKIMCDSLGVKCYPNFLSNLNRDEDKILFWMVRVNLTAGYIEGQNYPEAVNVMLRSALIGLIPVEMVKEEWFNDFVKTFYPSFDNSFPQWKPPKSTPKFTPNGSKNVFEKPPEGVEIFHHRKQSITKNISMDQSKKKKQIQALRKMGKKCKRNAEILSAMCSSTSQKLSITSDLKTEKVEGLAGMSSEASSQYSMKKDKSFETVAANEPIVSTPVIKNEVPKIQSSEDSEVLSGNVEQFAAKYSESFKSNSKKKKNKKKIETVPKPFNAPNKAENSVKKEVPKELSKPVKTGSHKTECSQTEPLKPEEVKRCERCQRVIDRCNTFRTNCEAAEKRLKECEREFKRIAEGEKKMEEKEKEIKELKNSAEKKDEEMKEIERNNEEIMKMKDEKIKMSINEKNKEIADLKNSLKGATKDNDNFKSQSERERIKNLETAKRVEKNRVESKEQLMKLSSKVHKLKKENEGRAKLELDLKKTNIQLSTENIRMGQEIEVLRNQLIVKQVVENQKILEISELNEKNNTLQSEKEKLEATVYSLIRKMSEHPVPSVSVSSRTTSTSSADSSFSSHSFYTWAPRSAFPPALASDEFNSRLSTQNLLQFPVKPHADSDEQCANCSLKIHKNQKSHRCDPCEVTVHEECGILLAGGGYYCNRCGGIMS